MIDDWMRDIRMPESGTLDAPAPGKPVYHLRRENNARRRNAMTFSCLGKVNGTTRAALRFWRSGLEGLLRAACRVCPATRAPLVIGLAESGIIPSALFHQILRCRRPSASWICSTRRPSAGICFSEHHSHAPDHVLPFPDTRPTELWFVEDEITTGRTLLGLSLELCRRLDQQQVRYIAFTDVRTPEMRRQFQTILSENGISFSVHTLFPPPPVGAPGRETLRLTAAPASRPPASEPVPESAWHYPDCRPALRRQFHADIPLPTGLTGSLLTVGEAVDLGVRMIQRNPGLQLHHITLSPWEIDDVDIRNRLDIGEAYYLYNLHTLRPPLYILNDPMDEAVGRAARHHLASMGFQIRRLALTP
jgi:hypothetical protein